MLRIGFAKGRGAPECLRLLASSGIEVPESLLSGRLPYWEAPGRAVCCVLARGADLPTLLHSGVVDAAFGSSLAFAEANLAELVPAAALGVARCRLSLLVPAGSPDAGTPRRVATRYPALARRLLPHPWRGARLMRLAGCVEIAIPLGMCDAVVDVVETGWTMRTLELEERQVLMTVSHGVYVHRRRPSALRAVRRLLPRLAWGSAAPSVSLTAAGEPPGG